MWGMGPIENSLLLCVLLIFHRIKLGYIVSIHLCCHKIPLSDFDMRVVFLLWNNGPFSASFLFISDYSYNKQAQFYNKLMWKMTIPYWDSNSQPLERQPSPITTRPGFLLFMTILLFTHENCWLYNIPAILINLTTL